MELEWPRGVRVINVSKQLKRKLHFACRCFTPFPLSSALKFITLQIDSYLPIMSIYSLFSDKYLPYQHSPVCKNTHFIYIYIYQRSKVKRQFGGPNALVLVQRLCDLPIESYNHVSTLTTRWRFGASTVLLSLSKVNFTHF